MLTLLAFLLSLCARALAVTLFTSLFPSHRRSLWAYVIMAPRGLAAAVLAYLPLTAGVPGSEGFPNHAFGFIALSNLVLTLGVPVVEKGLREGRSGEGGLSRSLTCHRCGPSLDRRGRSPTWICFWTRSPPSAGTTAPAGKGLPGEPAPLPRGRGG